MLCSPQNNVGRKSGARIGRLGVALALLAPLCAWAAPLVLRDALSPRNAERALRRRTQYIILHTTEAPAKSALAKLRERGEAHYVLDTDGVVYRVVDRKRVAYHAGRSMWNGTTNMDSISLGIEVIGYHDRDITEAQYAGLRELLHQLQRIYRIPDQRVLTHSMVAYGAPNRWHRRPHRGRKRCGMQFARDDVRERIGLSRKPAYDPDVRAGRLIEGDPYLAKILYGRASAPVVERRVAKKEAQERTIAAGRSAWDIARERYNRADTVYVFPDGKRQRGDEIVNWRALPPGTQVLLGEAAGERSEHALPVLGKDVATASELAGEAFNRADTFYRFPDGRVLSGENLTDADFKQMPPGTMALVGYVAGGAVAAKRSAFDICGVRWNHPSTYYRFLDGAFLPGHQVRENAIPVGTQIYYRR